MTHSQLPTAAQIGTYLAAHGWRFARPMKEPGAVYAYHQTTDDGDPIELFVPDEGHLDYHSRGRAVMAVTDVVAAYEERNRQDVLADLLAVEVPSAPPTPASVA